MFSTDFIFRQQENLVDNQNVRLDSGHYATKYYFYLPAFRVIENPPRCFSINKTDPQGFFSSHP